ncbi:MAG TPA: ABC transporter permease [Vicinamibacteria bacterium]|nr:ABC transporter permease [Vicinamibacteria bacterium]
MQDLRLAFRNLKSRPAFALGAILTLALGIGANTAMFTVLHGVLLAPLPYRNPDEVVVLNERTRDFPTLSVTRYNYDDWRARAKSFAGLEAFRPTSVTITSAGEPERVSAKMLSAGLLPLLGVSVPEGRAFDASDDRPGAEGVVVLGAAYRMRHFPEGAVGQALQIDGKPHTVIGVLPASFELFQPSDVYLPFGPWAATLPEDRGWHPGIFPVARLAPGTTLESARKEMELVAAQLATEHADSNEGVSVLVTRAHDQLVQNVRPALLMLLGAVALMLLIACANVASLLLVRAVDRQRELAVRAALGASRGRIIRQLVIESLVLAVAGGILGFVLGGWGLSLLTLTALPSFPRAASIGVAWPVGLFALALSALTGIAFGILPALQASRFDLNASLNEEGRGGSGSRRHRRTRAALVVAEIAVALVLLVGAGLLLRSFSALTRVAPGFEPDHLVVVNVPLSARRYGDDAARTAAITRMLDRVRALPGVAGAAVTTLLPMQGAGSTIHFNRASQPPRGPSDYVMAGYRAVTADYLSVLKVPLKKGRLLTEADRQGAPPVVVINESMARQYFAGRDPLGQVIQLGTEPDPQFPTMEVVGVVGDVKQSFETASKAEMFVPYVQYPDPILAGMYLSPVLVVRASGVAGSITPSLRAALHELDPEQPFVNLRTMQAQIDGTTAQPRLQTTLLVVFAILAATLAVVGVYGVVSYAVVQRIPEIGVRLALGATPRQVVGLVVREGTTLLAGGLGLGLVGAALASRALQRFLFEVQGLDPLSWLAASALLGLAAFGASYIPARRAAQVSPVTALRR